MARRGTGRLDWPALLGAGAYLASWGLANLWRGADDYWLALRLYPLGLLVTIAVMTACCLALLFRERPVSLAAKLIWATLLVLEVNEIWIYATCRLLRNPLLDADGNQIGEVEMAEIWGITVERTSCTRIFGDQLATGLSYVGAAVVIWLLLRAVRLRGSGDG